MHASNILEVRLDEFRLSRLILLQIQTLIDFVSQRRVALDKAVANIEQKYRKQGTQG